MLRYTRVVVALCALACMGQATAPKLPTDADLQQMLDKGDYRACLQQTARVLTLKGDAAKPYDPFVLQMRRGECFLHLNDGTTALAAFNFALNAADSGEKAEQARANIVMIKGSKGLKYTPPGGGAPISIIDPGPRHQAMALLCQELLGASKQQYNAAMAQAGIGGIIDFFPKAQELHALEMVGTGKDTQTRPMLTDMGERARTLIGAELRAALGRIEAIQARANQMVASGNTAITLNGNSWWVGDTRTGLTTEDRDALRGTIVFLGQLVTVCQQGKQAAQSFGADGKNWDPYIADGQELLQRAGNVLNAE